MLNNVFRILILSALMASTSAFGWSLSLFNGVSLGQELPPLNLQYVANAPAQPPTLTMIYFWGTWCEPCRETIPKLNKLHDEKHDGLVIVGLTDETEPVVKEFLRKIPIRYTVALDDHRKLFDSLKIRALPYAILITKERKVVWRGQPEDLHADELNRLLSAAKAAP
ncbi:TlpA family protein disulfide reductase [Piscinibacter terrae]|nr:TlpA disulfide reductase family protein [Albitalea terrae]